MKKRFVTVAVLTAALCLTACGGKSSASSSNGAYYAESAKEYAAEPAAGSYAEAAAYDEAVEAEESVATADMGTEESALREQDGQKIVYTGNMTIQTLEYEKSAASIRKKIKEAGGFSESESEYDNNYYWYDYNSESRNTRNLSITARIPSDKFESFMNSLNGDGKVMSRSMNAQNISQVYANKETYKKALEKEQERLLQMMDKAETIEDMITVESRLSEVERELNIYKTDLATMDKEVEYSTIYIELQEVKRYTEKVDTTTFRERVKYAFDDAISSFKEFCEEVVLFVVRNFPYLILLAIFIFVIVKISARNRARRIAMMSDPEYAKIMNEKARAKAEKEARKMAEKEAKRAGRKRVYRRQDEAPAQTPDQTPTQTPDQTEENK